MNCILTRASNILTKQGKDMWCLDWKENDC